MSFLTRSTGAAALATAAALALTACSGAGDTTADAAGVSLDFRPVILSSSGAQVDGDAADLVQQWGLPDTEDVNAAAAAFDARDCDALPAATDAVAAACSTDGQTLYVLGPVALDEGSIVSATAPSEEDPNGGLLLTFDGDGTETLADLTETVAAQPAPGNMIAIVVDGEVFSAPIVRAPITGGELQFTGSPDGGALEDLAERLGG